MSAAEQPNPSAVDAKLIYIVDDEAMIGDVVQIILRMEGYRPRFFQDPEQAWAAFVRDETKPALLLTDLIMGPMNGLELIERCKRAQPGLKTILYSGNAGDPALQHAPVKPDAFLRKPFLPRTLLTLLRSTLNVAGP